MDHNWVILFNLDPFKLPKDGTNELSWVTTQLEVQTRVPRQGETIDAVKMFLATRIGRVDLCIAFKRDLVRVSTHRTVQLHSEDGLRGALPSSAS